MLGTGCGTTLRAVEPLGGAAWLVETITRGESVFSAFWFAGCEELLPRPPDATGGHFTP